MLKIPTKTFAHPFTPAAYWWEDSPARNSYTGIVKYKDPNFPTEYYVDGRTYGNGREVCLEDVVRELSRKSALGKVLYG